MSAHPPARAVVTDAAPAAIGPYSQAIVAGPFTFVSGQLGLDPQTGAFVDGGVAAQARKALENLVAVLAAAGCSPADVVKCTVYLADMGDFATVNEAYASVFTGEPLPARAAVAVKTLPKNGLVEIDAIAYRAD
jgi:2-iminobutanoate/2-iminopropanoate deaminase